MIATYTYNALNQRIGVQEASSRTWTVYNGASADALPYADFNGSGALLTRYVSGPGMVNGAAVDELLARTSSGGTTAWYLTDKLDSVRDVVNSAGSVLDHVVYDSFGNIVTETNAGNGDRFKFAGMQYDAPTEQYFVKARWYSSALGRFTSQDPLGFGAGDTNLVRYVANDAIDHVDPGGMDDDDQSGSYINRPYSSLKDATDASLISLNTKSPVYLGPSTLKATIQLLTQNRPFMTALQNDGALGPAIAEMLIQAEKDPSGVVKIKFGKFPEPKVISDWVVEANAVRISQDYMATSPNWALSILHEMAHGAFQQTTGAVGASLAGEHFAYYYQGLGYQYFKPIYGPSPSLDVFMLNGSVNSQSITTWLNNPGNPYRQRNYPTWPVEFTKPPFTKYNPLPTGMPPLK